MHWLLLNSPRPAFGLSVFDKGTTTHSLDLISFRQWDNIILCILQDLIWPNCCDRGKLIEEKAIHSLDNAEQILRMIYDHILRPRLKSEKVLWWRDVTMLWGTGCEDHLLGGTELLSGCDNQTFWIQVKNIFDRILKSFEILFSPVKHSGFLGETVAVDVEHCDPVNETDCDPVTKSVSCRKTLQSWSLSRSPSPPQINPQCYKQLLFCYHSPHWDHHHHHHHHDHWCCDDHLQCSKQPLLRYPSPHGSNVSNRPSLASSRFAFYLYVIIIIVCMHNDNSDWQWERSLVMAAGNPQLFQYFYQWTRFKNQDADHGYPLFSGFQDQVSVAPPHIWHSESLYWETNSHLDQNFWSDWILEKL